MQAVTRSATKTKLPILSAGAITALLAPLLSITGTAHALCGVTCTYSDAWGTQEVAGSGWLGGAGVPIYSNGTNAPTGPSPDTYNHVNNINGTSTTTGIEWQCVELVNRLYLTKGWTTSTWTGNGTDLYANAPAGLTKEAQGHITYENVGDVIGMGGGSSGFGHVAVINTASGTIASQNTNVVYDTSFGLSNGSITYSGWANYTMQGVIHHPSTNLGQMGPKAPKDDFVIWRIMNNTDGTWYAAKNENGTAGALAVNGWIHGSPGDIPFTADFTGDKIADFGIYRLVNGVGTWYVEDGVTHNHTAIWGAQLGIAGDKPVVGDFDHDGYADFGVWRLVNGTDGTWYVNSGATGQHTAIWGAVHGSPGDTPVVGDFNGDGYADFGIYRVVNGTGYWYFKSSTTGQQISSAWGVIHGSSGDIPVVGDFDGDGYADFGIYRSIGGTGYWYVKSGVNVGNMIINGATQGGWAGDIPLAGNFG